MLASRSQFLYLFLAMCSFSSSYNFVIESPWCLGIIVVSVLSVVDVVLNIFPVAHRKQKQKKNERKNFNLQKKSTKKP